MIFRSILIRSRAAGVTAFLLYNAGPTLSSSMSLGWNVHNPGHMIIGVIRRQTDGLGRGYILAFNVVGTADNQPR